MKQHNRKQAVVTAVISSIGLLGLIPGANAHDGNASATAIHACLKTNSGNLRLISADEECRRRETAIHWAITGPAGANGINGTNGADGTNGANGVSAYDLAVANGFSGTEQAWLASLKGADGANGADGINGTNGVNGVDANQSQLNALQALVDVLHPVFEIGDIGPAGGIVFHVTNDRSHGLEAAPIDQTSAKWGCLGTDIAEIENLTEGGTVEGGTNGGVTEGGASEGGASEGGASEGGASEGGASEGGASEGGASEGGTTEGGTNTDDNSGAANTNAIIASCEAGTAAAVARDYVWPNGETDGFLPNRDELNLLFAQESVVGGFTIEEAYLSSSEFDASFAWIEAGNGQFAANKNTLFRVRAVRAF